MEQYPIDPILLRKRMAIPGMIAELSYIDGDAAIKYMRIWGEKKMAVSILFDELNTYLTSKKDV